ncbi:MAG: DUF3426 domain-containing protein [Thermodesulfobacteriota bacterium]
MIVTCASCLTKFNLDDSRISEKGAKVRCSRCQHIFYVARPPETQEEIIEDLESFAKYHEELMEPNQKEMKVPSPPEGEQSRRIPEEETSLPSEEKEQVLPAALDEEESSEVKVSKPRRMARKERRGPSLLFGILVILTLLLFGFFYLWTESGAGNAPYPLLEYPIQKITSLWQEIWGSEKEGLILRDLNRYEERIGEIPLYVIGGKVDNQSRVTKKHIKVKVVLFDQKKVKLAEKETFCGRTIGREELRNLPEAFFEGAMVIRPKTEKDMIAPPGKSIPFVVLFKNLSSEPTEFQIEIVESPNLN